MPMEEITMTDKAKRDTLFEELKNSDQPNERQVVKFSGSQSTGKCDSKGRMQYESTYSVAYPIA